jgi:signal peptidase I
MAPAHVGVHYHLNCGDCGFNFRCDATNVPSSGLAVCPNCGYRTNELTAANLRPGEQVLIDRWQLIGCGPDRGEIVAARLPDPSDDLVVKRVAALAGERLAIRAGDLYIDGEIVRKSLAELQAVRVLVNDNSLQPQRTPNLSPRWQPRRAADSRWERRALAYQAPLAATKERGDEIDWLDYHHWHCTASSAPRSQNSLILDNDSFNQNLARELHPVTDVLLSCQLQAEGEGQIALAVMDGAVRREVQIEPFRNRVVLFEDGRQILEKRLGANFDRRAVAIEFGLCDRQVLLSVAGRAILREPYERAAPAQRDKDVPHVAIGVQAIKAAVTNLRIWRDLYYLEPMGTVRPWQAEQSLSADEVALLGDNPPVSIDARHWPGSGGVTSQSLLGRVHRPFWAAGN